MVINNQGWRCIELNSVKSDKFAFDGEVLVSRIVLDDFKSLFSHSMLISLLYIVTRINVFILITTISMLRYSIYLTILRSPGYIYLGADVPFHQLIYLTNQIFLSPWARDIQQKDKLDSMYLIIRF